MAKYLEKAYGLGSTVIEPSLGHLDTNALEYLSGNLSHKARTDIAVMGFEKPFVTCHIDVSVISPVCETNKSKTVGLSISSTEKKKESDYSMRIKEQLGGDFVPAIFSSGGGIGNSAKKIINLISQRLESDTLNKLSDIKSEIKTDIVMALLRTRVQNLRCSRSSIQDQLMRMRNR